MSAVHLHVHSEYSLLDGACKIESLAERSAAHGQPALGLTDHGVMNGAVEHYKACRKHGIKPIMGFEAYFVDDRHSEAVRYERNHLTLLARSDEGFRNLVKLTSAGFLEGYRRGKANVDMELLSRYSEGVIALTGCLASRFCRRLVDDNPSEARAHVDELIQVFGAEDVYFELQRNGIADQDKANAGITRIANEVGRPVVGTADVHYLGREDFDNHAALLCVQTKSTIAEPKLSFDTNEFYLKDSQEMADSFSPWPEAIPTSLEIAQRCEVELELGKMLIPRYPTPEGEGEAGYLRRLAEAGLRERYGDPIPAAATERLELELEVIGRMGFDAYFLIVWDFVAYAKGNGIAVGPGRGSAAGSIVSYALDITEVDPLAYDLLFERFLNPERVSMPDIDIDFSVRGRERVIRYVADKYGAESVAQIITFGKMLPRNATRDAARVLGKEYAIGDRLAKLIPEPIMGRSKSFDEYLKDEPELKRAYDTDADARAVIDTARGLEGIVRNAGIHAAAVVIADRPLTDLVPLAKMEDRGAAVDGERAYRTVTQYSMKPIEEIGLLKMDFLGLRNLDVIEDCLDILERSSGERLDMKRLPLDDVKTFEMMARGDSIGVFQFESEGMRETLRKVRPNEFQDFIALNALYRPGAMAYIDTYARNKRNPEAIEYIDERLRSITEKTYGVMLYQEQLMQISKSVAGFTGAQADDLRKAIGKKNREAMAALKQVYFEGARASGTSESVITQLWSVNEAAADYSFNLAHAACYGLIGYRTAWLKANHPAEYMAALISSVMSTKDKVPFFVACCEDMGIEVLSPDVNECGHTFAVFESNVRFGLDAVKGVGSAAVDAIIAAREEGGRFASLWDFCRRVDCRAVNKKAIEALVKGGALDSTGASRTGMLEVLEQAQGAGHKAQQDALLGQASIFDLAEPAPGAGPAGAAFAGAPDLPVPALPDERAQLNVWEKETLGLFLSSHPLKEVRAALRARVDCSLADLRERRDGDVVTVGGMVTEFKRIRTRKGDPMMFATLDDLAGSVEMVVFNSAFEANADRVDTDTVLIVHGRVDQKDAGDVKLVVNDVERFQPSAEEIAAAEALADAEPAVKRLTVEVSPSVPEGFLDDLKELCRNNPGDHELRLVVGARTLVLGAEFRVAANGSCLAELDHLPGAARVA